MNRVLDIAWSREHDEHFRIGHLKSKFVVHSTSKFDLLFLTFVVCFDAMARLGQSSAPEAKLVNKMSTTVQLKLKSFILQTLTLNVQF